MTDRSVKVPALPRRRWKAVDVAQLAQPSRLFGSANWAASVSGSATRSPDAGRGLPGLKLFLDRNHIRP